jgi:hypothetical protein
LRSPFCLHHTNLRGCGAEARDTCGWPSLAGTGRPSSRLARCMHARMAGHASHFQVQLATHSNHTPNTPHTTHTTQTKLTTPSSLRPTRGLGQQGGSNPLIRSRCSICLTLRVVRATITLEMREPTVLGRRSRFDILHEWVTWLNGLFSIHIHLELQGRGHNANGASYLVQLSFPSLLD